MPITPMLRGTRTAYWHPEVKRFVWNFGAPASVIEAVTKCVRQVPAIAGAKLAEHESAEGGTLYKATRSQCI